MSTKREGLLPKTVEKIASSIFCHLCVAERRALPGAPFFFVIRAAHLFAASEANFYFMFHAVILDSYKFLLHARERYG